MVVGLTVSGGLALTAEPASLLVRWLLLALALPVLAVGVAGYLNTATGAGPAEAAVLVGWLWGADVGPGTVLVVVALGPAVSALRARLPRWETPATL